MMKQIKRIFSFFTVLLLFSALKGSDIDFKAYGAGALDKPGRSFYVSPAGKDTNDGKTLQKRDARNTSQPLK